MRSWIIRIIHVIEFLMVYLWEVIKSNLQVAYDVVTPTHRMKPAMIEVDIKGLSDRELLAYSNLITMTPGTLSVDVTEKRDKLLIHAMYSENPDDLAQEINKTLRKRVTNVF